LAANGASVVLNDIDETVAEQAARVVRSDFGNCISCAGDAADLSCINRMVEMAVKEYGKLTIAVANAGITLFGDFFDYKADDFNKVLRTNLAGSFFLAQAAARQMRQQGSGGSILFMSSVTGHQAHKDLAAY